MMETIAVPRPLRALGVALLGFALAWRLLVPSPPAAPALLSELATALLAAGGGLVLLDAWIARCAIPQWGPLILGLAILPACSVSSLDGILRGLQILAALVAAAAARQLVRKDGFGPPLRAALLGLGLPLALAGLAQSLLRPGEIADAVRAGAIPDPGPASWRARGTLLSANAHAALLAALTALALGAKGRARVLGAGIFAAGFVAAGSLGAALCAAATAILFGRRLASRRGAGLAMAATLLFATAGAAVLAEGPGGFARAKSGSIAHRLDFFHHALRLLPGLPLTGFGFASFADQVDAVRQPGEAASRHAHASYLELLLEAGPALALALAFLGFLRRRRRASAEGHEDAGTRAPDPEPSPALVRALGTGFALALLGAPWASGLAALLPARISHPGLEGVLLLLLAGGAGRWLFGRSSGSSTQAAALILVLHAGFDLDLQLPAMLVVWAWIASLMPGRVAAVPASRRSPAGVLLLALTGLLLPLPLAGALRLAASRDSRATWKDEVFLSRFDSPGDLLWRDPRLAARCVLALGPVDRGALARALPAPLAGLPSFRAAQAQALVRDALRDPAQAQAGLEQLPALHRPGEWREAHFLAQRAALLALAGDRDAAKTAARAAQLAAEVRGLPVPPILLDLDLLPP
jgi:hypothetical protein